MCITNEYVLCMRESRDRDRGVTEKHRKKT